MILQCYQHAKTGKCLASMANAYNHCILSNRTVASCNARIVVNPRNSTARIVCIKKIKENAEVLVSYGRSYNCYKLKN